MQLKFQGIFDPSGWDGEVGLQFAVDTTRPHQPSCSAELLANSELFEELNVGADGIVKGDTNDGRSVAVNSAVLIGKETRQDKVREAQFEIESIKIANEKAQDLLAFEGASVRCRWYLSGDPRLNAWIESGDTLKWAEAIKSRAELEVAPRFVLDTRPVKSDWHPDGLLRTAFVTGPHIELLVPSFRVPPADIQSLILRVDDELRITALCLGFALDVPIVNWQRDEYAIQSRNLGRDSKRFLRCEQELGQSPMFSKSPADKQDVPLDDVVIPEKMARLQQHRGHLEAAIQSLLWAPSLPRESEFIMTCTCLEALKDWYLSNSDYGSNFSTKGAFKGLAKEVRALLRKLDEDSKLKVPLDDVVGKVADLERPAFGWALRQMVSEFEVSDEELPRGFSLDFIGLRNVLVHTGAPPSADELDAGTRHARVLARVLIDRILNGASPKSG